MSRNNWIKAEWYAVPANNWIKAEWYAASSRP